MPKPSDQDMNSIPPDDGNPFTPSFSTSKTVRSRLFRNGEHGQEDGPGRMKHPLASSVGPVENSIVQSDVPWRKMRKRTMKEKA
jgi:hypothetical protein